MADVNGLNLFLKLQDPLRMPELAALIQRAQPALRRALQALHSVHFARFVPTPDQSTLLVVTEFDGDLKSYVMDFAVVLGDEFSAILEFVEAHPPLPVQKHPREFWEFVERNNQPVVPVWSAYPQRSVIDIVGPRRASPLSWVDARPAKVSLEDVQGNVLRGYGSHARFALHVALAVDDAPAARSLIAALTEGTGALQITTARPWQRPPHHFLNVGFTHMGLAALGVPAATLRSFPEAFRAGPAVAHRAAKNGDTGPSDPKHWLFGGPHTPDVHLVVSVYAEESATLQAKIDALQALFAGGGVREVYRHAAQALPDEKVHFGYQDGIGQPRIATLDGVAAPPDLQPAANVGDFLLGKDYRNRAGGNFIDRLPADLCDNGSYAAVRMMRQDTAAFDRLIRDVATRHGIDAEMVAAKLLGRWRSGAPLSLHPDSDPGAAAAINAFDFAPTADHPAICDDALGERCPVGSHIRRMNPRGSLVTGKPYSRRIVRRGMPYGPPFDPANPDDGAERGLFGLFICADLEDQFEFLLRFWANGDLSAPGIRGSNDPIIGSQQKGGEFVFSVPELPEPVRVDVPRLVHTAGSVYLFMPGVGGLRRLASPPQTARPVPQTFDLDAFDPNDAAFLENPYPAYAAFRKHRPVHYVGGAYKSHWVFTHSLVAEVLDRTDVFLKNRRPPEPDGSIADANLALANGLFFMDPPRHTEVRPMLDPLFDTAIAGIESEAEEVASARVAAARRKGSLELWSDYAVPLPLRVFASVFGIDAAHLEGLAQWVATALAGNNKALDRKRRFAALTARMALGTYFEGVRAACPHGKGHLLSRMCERAQAPAASKGLSPVEFQQTAAHFALGGYLSTSFLITTGVYNLLSHPAQLDELRTTPSLMPHAIREMLRYDAPFQLTDRYVAKPTRLGDHPLQPGDKVTMVFGSANRDETVFGDDADAFDITRVADPAKPHFALGAGIHRCIGEPLVDRVAPIAIGKLIDGLANLALGDERPVWQPDPYFRSLSKLALRI